MIAKFEYLQETSAKHLKFTIKSGYDSFCAVYGVTVMGSTLSGRSPMPVRKAEAARLLGVKVQENPEAIHLDVVDDDLYPRHISQGEFNSLLRKKLRKK